MTGSFLVGGDKATPRLSWNRLTIRFEQVNIMVGVFAGLITLVEVAIGFAWWDESLLKYFDNLGFCGFLSLA